jgi:hypothetical protein
MSQIQLHFDWLICRLLNYIILITQVIEHQIRLEDIMNDQCVWIWKQRGPI